MQIIFLIASILISLAAGHYLYRVYREYRERKEVEAILNPDLGSLIVTTTPDADLWKSWRVYLVRWLIFGAVAGLLQPVVNNFDQFWEQKLYQMLSGLPFGLACAVVFTLAQNKLNP